MQSACLDVPAVHSKHDREMRTRRRRGKRAGTGGDDRRRPQCRSGRTASSTRGSVPR